MGDFGMCDYSVSGRRLQPDGWEQHVAERVADAGRALTDDLLGPGAADRLAEAEREQRDQLDAEALSPDGNRTILPPAGPPVVVERIEEEHGRGIAYAAGGRLGELVDDGIQYGPGGPARLPRSAPAGYHQAPPAIDLSAGPPGAALRAVIEDPYVFRPRTREEAERAREILTGWHAPGTRAPIDSDEWSAPALTPTPANTDVDAAATVTFNGADLTHVVVPGSLRAGLADHVTAAPTVPGGIAAAELVSGVDLEGNPVPEASTRWWGAMWAALRRIVP